MEGWNDPLDSTDGWQSPWSIIPLEEEPEFPEMEIIPAGIPSPTKASGVLPETMSVAFFLEPLIEHTELHARATGVQKKHYVGRDESFFDKLMFAGSTRFRTDLDLYSNLLSVAPVIRHSLKTLLFNPELSMLPSEVSNDMKLYFCGDGYYRRTPRHEDGQIYMFDSSNDVTVHIRDPGDESRFMPTSELKTSGTEIFRILRQYTEEMMELLRVHGMANYPTTDDVQAYVVVGVELDSPGMSTDSWMSLNPPTLEGTEGYVGMHDVFENRVPDLVWVPMNPSLFPTRRNYPMLSSAQFEYLRNSFEKMSRHTTESGHLYPRKSTHSPETVNVGFWMRPPPYSIISPILFGSLSSAEPLSIQRHYFLVYSPFLNHSMLNEPPLNGYLEYSQEAYPEGTENMFVPSVSGAGKLMMELSNVVSDLVATLSPYLNIVRLKEPERRLSFTISTPTPPPGTYYSFHLTPSYIRERMLTHTKVGPDESPGDTSDLSVFLEGSPSSSSKVTPSSFTLHKVSSKLSPTRKFPQRNFGKASHGMPSLSRKIGQRTSNVRGKAEAEDPLSVHAISGKMSALKISSSVSVESKKGKREKGEKKHEEKVVEHEEGDDVVLFL
jgi:hypothetical protein